MSTSSMCALCGSAAHTSPHCPWRGTPGFEAGFRAAVELLRDKEDRYGIGSMISQWTADEVADDLLEREGVEPATRPHYLRPSEPETHDDKPVLVRHDPTAALSVEDIRTLLPQKESLLMDTPVDSKIAVPAAALRAVLQALEGPEHRIRELQVVRSLPADLAEPEFNPIGALVKALGESETVRGYEPADMADQGASQFKAAGNRALTVMEEIARAGATGTEYSPAERNAWLAGVGACMRAVRRDLDL